MKKYLTTLTFSIICFCCFAQSSFIKDMAAKWQHSGEYMIEFARFMPEELYSYKPTEAEMTFSEQLIHICGNMVWLSGSYLDGKPFDVDLANPPSDKQGIIEVVQQCFDYAAETIANFDYKTIEEEVEFFAGPMSKRRVFFLLTDHVTHHRGQLVVYLRMNKMKPPSYRGW